MLEAVREWLVTVLHLREPLNPYQKTVESTLNEYTVGTQNGEQSVNAHEIETDGAEFVFVRYAKPVLLGYDGVRNTENWLSVEAKRIPREKVEFIDTEDCETQEISFEIPAGCENIVAPKELSGETGFDRDITFVEMPVLGGETS